MPEEACPIGDIYVHMSPPISSPTFLSYPPFLVYAYKCVRAFYTDISSMMIVWPTITILRDYRMTSCVVKRFLTFLEKPS